MTIDYTRIVNDKLKGTMAELTVRHDLLQPYGYIHGGALMTLMDSLAGMATALNLAPGQGFLTIEFKVNFLRSVRGGRVTGEAIAVHIGWRTHVWQVSAQDEQGRRLALATLTQLVVEQREEGE